MVLNLKWVDLSWIKGKSCLQWGWWGNGTGCPEVWLVLHPWRLSRQGWTRLWATWWSCGCPCSLQGSCRGWPIKVPAISKHSMIPSSPSRWNSMLDSTIDSMIPSSPSRWNSVLDSTMYSMIPSRLPHDIMWNFSPSKTWVFLNFNFILKSKN